MQAVVSNPQWKRRRPTADELLALKDLYKKCKKDRIMVSPNTTNITNTTVLNSGSKTYQTK